MSDEQKYTIQGLEEYIRQGEPQQRERGETWKVAIGLQQVDGLTPSEYLLDTAKRHIEGDISIGEAKMLIDSYYKSAAGRKEVENDRTEEADKVSARITEILAEKTFSFTPAQLTSIHRRLFEGIYKQAGRIRDYNITKNEWVLGGKTVYYASADTISETLDYDMGQERAFDYANLNVDDAISHLARFCANIWQIHPFCEGNTRTTAVFMIKYLRTLGFNVVNDVFADNSWYFRNALVRANYSDLTQGITETTIYLVNFFRSMLLGEEHDLRNRMMHIEWKKTQDITEIQSANESDTVGAFAADDKHRDENPMDGRFESGVYKKSPHGEMQPPLLHCYMLHVTLRISHPPHAVRPPREAVGHPPRQLPYSNCPCSHPWLIMKG